MRERIKSSFAGWRGRFLAVFFVLAFAGVGVAGSVAYGDLADPTPARVQIGDRDVVLLEIVGSQAGAQQLVCRGLDVATPETRDAGPSLRPRGELGDCEDQVAWYQSALKADLLLIISYVTSLGGLSLLGWLLFVTRRAQTAGRAAAVAVVMAALFDAAENLLLWRGLEGLLEGDAGWVWRWAAAAAVTKFSLLLPALVVAVSALLVILGRALIPSADYRWIRTPPTAEGSEKPTVVPPPPVLDHRGGLWPPGGGALPTPQMLGREPAEVGICVSGGGIRSGTVSLAALHELRKAGILGRARYIVSVSGGGYAAGAWLLALQKAARQWRSSASSRDDETVRDVADVFAPSSPELDHTRRHGRYVADGAAEWLGALGVLLRGLVASLALIAGLVTVVGILLGRFYFSVPLFHQVSLPMPSPEGQAPGFPALNPGVTTAGLTLAVTGLAVWVASVFLLAWWPSVAARLVKLVRPVFLIAAVVTVLGVAVPAVVWAYVRLAWWMFGEQDVPTASVAAGAAGGTVGLAYLGALASIMWRRREKLSKFGKSVLKSGQAAQRRVPQSLAQLVIVWLVLAVLALVYGALLTAVTWVSMRASTFDLLTWWRDGTVGFWPQVYVVLVPALFLLTGLLVDQTWMSLHPFYRRRLASAFSVRRRRRKDGVEYAEAYDFSEPTPLSTYAEPVAGLPQVIFAAAANLSGFERTPPGRHATSYSLSHDWIGGPLVGYVQTSALTEDRLKPPLTHDLTVQSAVAVSGAAFASAMGRQQRAFQTLLALSNARLGTWLPNPAWLSERSGSGDWLQPRLPRIRRLTYLLREIVGSFDAGDRLLLVTDGGHYENLGLVELLRHRPRTAYCVDASGDAPPLATTLGDAIALAREELGISITLDKPLDLVPGSAEPLLPSHPLTELSARLSKSVVLTGTITYPEAFQLPGEHEPSAVGKLILAKARLHPDMPADVLSYAHRNPTFPYDSTSDQWFEQGQFNAYYALGAFLGSEAVKTGPATVAQAAEVFAAHAASGEDMPPVEGPTEGQATQARTAQAAPFESGPDPG